MRIQSLAADGLLSFDNFTTNFSKGLSVIVGPNGAGKSNIGRLVDLIRAALRTADRPTEADHALLNLHSFAAINDPTRKRVEVRARVEFTGDIEQELLLTYIQACVATALVGPASGADVSAADAWIAEQVTPEKIQPLMHGTIAISHPATSDGSWHIVYEFDADDGTGIRTFRWILRSNLSSADIIVGLDDNDRRSLPTSTLSNRLFPPEGAIPAQRRTGLPPGAFSVATLLPQASLGMPCALDLNTHPAPRAVRHFTDLLATDVNADNNRHYGLAAVLRRLLECALTRSSDASLRLGGSWADDRELGTADFAMRLLHLKNGPSQTRTNFDDVTRRFAAFTNGRQLDVVLPPSTGPTTSLADIEPQVVVSVDPVPPGERSAIRQVPLEFAGSGAREALLLALALESSRDSILVLDEPAARLHPTMQRRLASAVLESMAQVVLITHSPYVVPYDRSKPRPQMMRFARDAASSTQAYIVPPNNLDVAMAKTSSNGNEGLPFASKAILCEGRTDVAAVRALATRLHLDLEAANIAVVDCDSRNNQPGYIQFTADLHLPALVISDGDASKTEKPETREQVAAVQRAVQTSGNSELILFAEDFETALGVQKDKQHPMSGVISRPDFNLASRPEIAHLAERLEAFCT